MHATSGVRNGPTRDLSKQGNYEPLRPFHPPQERPIFMPLDAERGFTTGAGKPATRDPSSVFSMQVRPTCHCGRVQADTSRVSIYHILELTCSTLQHLDHNSITIVDRPAVRRLLYVSWRLRKQPYLPYFQATKPYLHQRKAKD